MKMIIKPVIIKICRLFRKPDSKGVEYKSIMKILSLRGKVKDRDKESGIARVQTHQLRFTIKHSGPYTL